MSPTAVNTAPSDSKEMIFYDIPALLPGKDEGKFSCFSFNPWKTRLILNYKGMHYHTQFVEYPDLAPMLSGLGLPPNEPGTAFADYSSPAIRLPDGRMLMHSLPIASALDTLTHSPSLHLSTNLHLEAEKVVEAVGGTVWWDMMVAGQEMLPERSREYFAKTRKEVFGASLEELAEAKGGNVAWAEAERSGGCLEGLSSFLKANKRRGAEDGPYVLGKEPSYADFVVVGLFECFKRCHPPSYERLMKFDQSFKALHEACGDWLVRDD